MIGEGGYTAFLSAFKRMLSYSSEIIAYQKYQAYAKSNYCSSLRWIEPISIKQSSKAAASSN